MDEISITNGILLTLAVYNMFVFLGRGKTALSNFTYSLLCLVFVFITLVVRVYPNYSFFSQSISNVLVAWSCIFIAFIITFFSHTIFDLSKSELRSLRKNGESYTSIGKRFGVSNNTVKRRCKKFNIE